MFFAYLPMHCERWRPRASGGDTAFAISVMPGLPHAVRRPVVCRVLVAERP